MQLFKGIIELCEDSNLLLCVLIGLSCFLLVLFNMASITSCLDEVESLTSARRAAMSGSEPSDSIRVVNAVITQIDRLRQYSNCLILTTSNITGALGIYKSHTFNISLLISSW